MKLEEKRRAIEAQKKKVNRLAARHRQPVQPCFKNRADFSFVQVEAAFTRHRQKMGRTAFLNVVRRKGVTTPVSPSSGGETPSPSALAPSLGASPGSMERAERCKPDGAAPKSLCEDGGGAWTQHRLTVVCSRRNLLF